MKQLEQICLAIIPATNKVEGDNEMVMKAITERFGLRNLQLAQKLKSTGNEEHVNADDGMNIKLIS